MEFASPTSPGGHTREVLCVDCEGDVVVSGGRDTSVLVHR